MTAVNFRPRLAALAFAAALVAAPASAETEVQVITSPGGIEAWLVEEPSIPMVAFEIIFEGGASRDPADKQGSANFLSTMLDAGAGDLDSAAFSATAERLGLRAGFSAGRDSFSVSARLLTENREEALDLLRTALIEPRFDADAMERMRASILASIRSNETDPGALAAKAWRRALFEGDPYARVTEGDAETVAALTADDLREAHARLLNRSRMHVAVVGDVSAEELGPILDRLLGDLPNEAWEPLPDVTPADERGLEIVELDVPQSSATLVQEGLARDHPDFMTAYVMNYILGGGGFTSRLTTEVREKRGLTYSVYSYLMPYERTAIMAAGVSSDNARIAEAVDVIKAEWTRMRDEGVTEEELEAAKRYLTGAYPLRFDSNAKIAGQLAGIKRQGFGPEYIRERNGMIEAVTREEVARVAGKLLAPERLKIVVVGKPEGLVEPGVN